MSWVVDDGPLGFLARRFEPSWAWPAATFEILESVANGAGRDNSGRRQKLLAMRFEAEPCIRVRRLLVGTPAADVLSSYLRPSTTSATRNLGEDESIAYCMTEAVDAVFVTADKQAAYTALAELGPGRVATPFDLWSWLLERDLITSDDREALDTATARSDTRLPGVPRRYSAMAHRPVVGRT